jgi:HMG (high mobility group) box
MDDLSADGKGNGDDGSAGVSIDSTVLLNAYDTDDFWLPLQHEPWRDIAGNPTAAIGILAGMSQTTVNARFSTTPRRESIGTLYPTQQQQQSTYISNPYQEEPDFQLRGLNESPNTATDAWNEANSLFTVVPRRESTSTLHLLWQQQPVTHLPGQFYSVPPSYTLDHVLPPPSMRADPVTHSTMFNNSFTGAVSLPQLGRSDLRFSPRNHQHTDSARAALLDAPQQANTSLHSATDSETMDVKAMPLNRRRASMRSGQETATIMTPAVDDERPMRVPQALRPLTPYNFFFRIERNRILQEMYNAESGCAVTDPMILSNEFYAGAVRYRRVFVEHVLQDQWRRDPSQKRKHRKVHGKISFRSLTKRIAAKWKALPDEVKDAFREISDRDHHRYANGGRRT